MTAPATDPRRYPPAARKNLRHLADRLDRALVFLRRVEIDIEREMPATAATLRTYLAEASGIVEELKTP